MKLAFIFPEVLPLKKARSISVINTASALSKLIDTTLIIPKDSAPKKDLEAFYGVDLSKLNLTYIPKQFFGIKSNKIFNFFLKKTLKIFDIFYVRHLKTAEFLIKNKLHSQKVVFEVHEVFSESLKEEKPFATEKIEKLKKLEKKVYTEADALIFINRSLKRYVMDYFGIPEKQNIVIYLGINAKIPFLKKDFLEIKELFYCGNFYRWKGLGVAFKALKEVEGITLNLIGDTSPERKNELIALAKSLGIEDRVKFWGYKPQKEVLQILQNQAKLTLIPNDKSVYNFFSFPLKMLEYMITSNIVIASATPVIKEVIKDGENGFLFEVGNAEDLVKTIEKVLNLPCKILQKISYNAYNTAKNFTYEHRAKEIVNFLKKV